MSAVIETPKRHVLAAMGGEGDTKTIWDPRNPDEVAAAKAAFDSFKAKGFSIFRVGPEGEKAALLSKWDPDAEKMIAVPRIVAG